MGQERLTNLGTLLIEKELANITRLRESCEENESHSVN